METLDEARLVESVRRDAPLISLRQAESALKVTLSALLDALPRSSRAALRGAVPKGLSVKLVSDAQTKLEPAELSIEELCDKLLLAWRQADEATESKLESRVRMPELVQIVCGALATQLHPETRERIARDLPESVARLFERHAYAGVTQQALRTGHGHTLAEGQPGAARPLSAAATGSDQPLSAGAHERPQPNSVAEANPHARTKVSSACGLTQQREHESLANGRPRRA